MTPDDPSLPDPALDAPPPDLDTIITRYLEAQERGEDTRPTLWIERYPHHATELREFFAAEMRLDRLTPRPNPSEAPEFSPQDRFGDFDILEPIARGGMGRVYRARQRSLGREVALKMVLAGQWARPDERERFTREAMAVAALDHPNIVPVYEVGEHAHVPYFSMRLLSGGSLAERLPTLRRETRRGIEILEKVTRAVHAAHEAGILHRDLKPGNILFDGDGSPQISDFGLAKSTSPTVELTLTGTALGTPAYMAPEQAEGESCIGTDLYAIGAILYELLTGQTPFVGATAYEIIARAKSEPPRPPRHLDPQVPRDLETIALVCLEKDPRKRFSTAAELADEFSRYLRREPIQARPVSRLVRTARWSQRNPIATALLLSLTLLAAGALISAIHFESRRKDAIELVQRTQTAERISQLRLYESLRVQADSWIESDRIGRRVQALAALGKAAQLLDELDPGTEPREDAQRWLRDRVARASARMDLAPDPDFLTRACFNDPSPPHSANHDTTIYDASLERSASRLEDGTLQVALPAPRRPGQNGPIASGRRNFVTWSVDDLHLDNPQWHGPFLSAVDRLKGVSVLGAVDGATAAITGTDQDPPSFASRMRFESCDGAIAVDFMRATIRSDGALDPSQIRVFAAIGEREIHRFTYGIQETSDRLLVRDRVTRLELSPDGTRMAVRYFSRPEIDIVETESLRSWVSVRPSAPANAVRWGPRSKSLLVGGTDGSVARFDTLTGDRIRTYASSGSPIYALARWDTTEPDPLHLHHEMIAAISANGRLRVWTADSSTPELDSTVAVRPSGNRPPILHTHSAPADGRSQKDPTRRLVLFQEGLPPQAWRILYGDVYQTVAREVDARDVAVDAKGRMIAVATKSGVSIYEGETGALCLTLPLGSTRQVLFQARPSRLLTSGSIGIWSWPWIPSSDGSITLGEPTPIETSVDHGRVASSGDKIAFGLTAHHFGSGVTVRDSTGDPSQDRTVDHAGVRDVALGANGRYLITAGWNAQDVRLWDLDKLELGPIHLITGWTRARLTLTSVLPADSPEGSWVVASTSDAIRAWELGTFETSFETLRDDPILHPAHLALAPRRIDLLAAGREDIDLFDVRRASNLTRLPAAEHPQVAALEFGPDGRTLLVAGRNLVRWNLDRLADQWQAVGLEVPLILRFSEHPFPEQRHLNENKESTGRAASPRPPTHAARLSVRVGSFFDPARWRAVARGRFLEDALNYWIAETEDAPRLEASLNRMQVLTLLEQYREARDSLDPWLGDEQPRYTEVRLRRGNTYELEGDDARALIEYQLASQPPPSTSAPSPQSRRAQMVSLEARYRRALIHERQQETSIAEELLRSIVQESPSSFGAWHRLAWIHATADADWTNLDLALDAAKRSAEWKSLVAEYTLTLGLVHWRRGETLSAIENLEAALRRVFDLEPGDSGPSEGSSQRPDLALLALADCYLEVGMTDRADSLLGVVRRRAQPVRLPAEPLHLRQQTLEKVSSAIRSRKTGDNNDR